MRVLIDTNLFISYLLHPNKANTVNLIFNALRQGRFTLLLPHQLLKEIHYTITRKPYLAKVIGLEALNIFIMHISTHSETIAPVKKIHAISRDRKDDYLLTYAIVGQADYLVSGDKDLLKLNEKVKIQLRPLQILAPRTFANRL